MTTPELENPPIPAHLHQLINRGGIIPPGAAACAGKSPLFDLEIAGESTADRRARHHAAKWICARCDAQFRCGAAARRGPAGLLTGIWGGDLYTETGRTGRERMKPTCPVCGAEIFHWLNPRHAHAPGCRIGKAEDTTRVADMERLAAERFGVFRRPPHPHEQELLAASGRMATGPVKVSRIRPARAHRRRQPQNSHATPAMWFRHFPYSYLPKEHEEKTT